MAKIPTVISNQILESYRQGADATTIARHFGYTLKEVETVIYPNGKDSKILPLVISRRLDPKRKQELVKEKTEKKEKWKNAGKKSWETRKKKAGLLIKENNPESPSKPKALDQPIVELLPPVEQLETMKKEDKEKLSQFITEGIEYMEVALSNFKSALELLKK